MSWRIACGDAREVLASMAAESVHCIVTSPPYYGLRDYKLPPLVWGGKHACLCASTNGIIATEVENDRSSTTLMPDLSEDSSALPRAQQKRKGEPGAQDLQQKLRDEISIQGGQEEAAQSAKQLGSEQYQLEGRGQMGGTVQDDSSPTRNPWHSETPLYDGASLHNASTSWETTDPQGASSSSERNQNGQQDREPRGGNPRLSERLRPMPPLSQLVLGTLECLVCHGCKHQWDAESYQRQRGSLHGANAQAGNTLSGVSGTSIAQGAFCRSCGAWRGSLGLEPSLELYLSHLLEVMRGVRRVLRKDGVAFINMGDSYVSSPSGNPTWTNWQTGGVKDASSSYLPRTTITDGLKPLDLMGVPWRFAEAMLADGWYRRSAIVWEKSNPMPESVAGWRWEQHKVKVRSQIADMTMKSRADGRRNPVESTNPNLVAQWADCPGCARCEPNNGLVLRKGAWRPTSSYEHVFMFTKSDKYYADGEGVRETLSPLTLADSRNATGRHTQGQNGSKYFEMEGQDQDKPSWYRAKTFVNPETGRNLRDTWRINTQAFSGAHFATYPVELVERCIKIGTSEAGCCPRCGSQWARVMQVAPEYLAIGEANQYPSENSLDVGRPSSPSKQAGITFQAETLGYRATCSCNAGEPVPATVLDPFAGSGSTGVAAVRLGREFVGIDLSEKYCAMARRRIATEAPQANDLAVAASVQDIQLALLGREGERA